MTTVEYDNTWITRLPESEQQIVKTWISRNGFELDNTHKIIWDQGKWIGVTYRRDEYGRLVHNNHEIALRYKEFTPVIHHIPAVVIDHALKRIFDQGEGMSNEQGSIQAVPANLDSDHPDIERVDYPAPEEGSTQNEDSQAGPPREEVST